MRHTSAFFIIGVCALAGVAWFWLAGSNEPASGGNVFDGSEIIIDKDASSRASQSAPSPFALEDSSFATESSPAVSQSITGSLVEGSEALANLGSQAGRQLAQTIDVTTLGRSAISDAEFLQLINALRSDPDLVQQLIDEFRQETNAVRLAELSRLLGEVGGENVTLTASELIFSGDAVHRQIGLDLLQRIQPGNATARDIASTLLATEVEPTILVSTLTTLVEPGVVDDNSRQFISDQVAFLADHSDAVVRSASLNILSRWSKDGQYTEVLRNGLTDEESFVRESAVYALVGHDNVSQTLINSLLSVAIDSKEEKRVRRGAIQALKGMPIDDHVRQQVAEAELDLNTVRR